MAGILYLPPGWKSAGLKCEMSSGLDDGTYGLGAFRAVLRGGARGIRARGGALRARGARGVRVVLQRL